MGMRLSGARGGLSGASSSAREASGAPEKPSGQFFVQSVPVHKAFVSAVGTEDDTGGCEEGWASREGSIAEG